MNELRTTATRGDRLVIRRARRTGRHVSRIGIALWLLTCLLIPTRAHAQSAPRLPAGFHATIYARSLTAPTAIALGPDGRLYVAEQAGQIVAIGHAGRVVIASGFATPLGLTWNRGLLYVSSTGQIATLTPNRGYWSFRRKIIVRGLPNGRHQNDGVAFHGAWLYVGVGSTCNACVEADSRSATIMRFHLDGSHAQIFARGLRNPYGLAFRPGTAQLYATDNGRDDYGNSVPDELNRIVRGERYGWPNCWGRGGGGACAGTIAPVALFEPHASADGLIFYTGTAFPQRYRGDAFVAEWGDSVNGLGTGQRVKDVHFVGQRATVSDFVTGLNHPLAVIVDGHGALLVADYGTGIVWRIAANGY